jgi:hypothetical protein
VTRLADSRGVIVVLLVILILFPSVVSLKATVDELQVSWQQFLPGVSGTSVIQTSDGGYLVLGSNATLRIQITGTVEQHIYENFDQVLVKADSEGDFLWSKTYPIEGYKRLEPWRMIQTNDGSYVIASVAVAENKPDQTEDVRTNKICLIKVDSQGNLQWSKLLQGYNSTYNDVTGFSVNGLVETSDVGFAMVTGYNHMMYRQEAWLVKVNHLGELAWNKSIPEFGAVPSDMLQANDGGYVLTGSRAGHPSFHGPIVLFKVDSTGDFQWEKTFGGEDDYYYTNCKDSVATSDGGYLIAGSTSSQTGSSHGWLVKTDEVGSLVWDRLVGYDNSEILSIAKATTSGYVFAGTITTYVAWAGEVDNVGNLMAETQIRTEDHFGNIAPRSIIQVEDGSSVFVGDWSITSDAAVKKMWLVKIGSTEYSPPDSLLLPVLAVAAVVVVSVGLVVYFKKKR